MPFGRYAIRRIRGALLDELRSADWATRSLRAKVRQRDAVQDALAAKLGRAPTAAETSKVMGVTVDALQRLDIDLHTSVVLRLDVIATAAGADALLPAVGRTPEAALVERERQAYLRDAVDSLPARLRLVVRGCFFEERPMRDLAADLSVSESRISQMRGEALRLLREGLNSQLDPDLLPPPAVGGTAARRKASYFSQIAARSSYRDRLSAVAEDSGAGSGEGRTS